ncbi:MAG: hypothetical protein AAF363_17300 [Bacteroidota bacterium]
MYKLISFLSIVLRVTNSLAQDSLLQVELKKHIKLLNFSEWQISGDGFEWIKQESEEAQFVLIGEEHGLKEVPQFVTHLSEEIQAYGFNHFVTEAGPNTSIDLLKALQSDNYSESFKAYFDQNPLGIAFYFWKNETEMLYKIYQNFGASDQTLWPIDQEFIVSLRPYFKHLENKAPDADSKALALKHYEKADSAFNKAIIDKNFGGVLLYSLKEEDFSKLRKEFSGSPESVQIINDLQESRHIYSLFAKGKIYQSNLDRIAHMKENFHRFYNKAIQNGESKPKAVFKFGMTHMFRGRSMLNIYDIGNMASELAEANDSKSFHIALLPKEGTVNQYFLFNDPAAKQAPYDGKKSFKFAKPFFNLVENNDDWLVVDLKPIRELLFKNKIKDLDPALENFIWSFDCAIVMPTVTAAENH